MPVIAEQGVHRPVGSSQATERPKKYSKQEQEPASSEVIEAAPGVLRLQLPANVPGVGHVNCYALCDGDGVTLVDSGLPGEASWSAMLDRFSTAGIPLKRVHTVLVTHSHIDHYGGCARLLEETGAVLLAHEAFAVSSADSFAEEDFDGAAAAGGVPDGGHGHGTAPVGDLAAGGSAKHVLNADSGYYDLLTDDIGDDDDIVDFEDLAADDSEVLPARARRRRPYGAASAQGTAGGEAVQPRPAPWGPSHHLHPREALRLLARAGRGGEVGRLPSNAITPEPDVRVGDGERLRLAGREWIAMHTPGHTMDHICLWEPSGGVLLAGDHVLPTITPHIAGVGETHDPLGSFLESLRSVGSLERVTVCLPAHGHPFTGLGERARDIRRHHAEQLDVLLSAARDLPDAPVEAFMQVLFQPRAWGYLAASETFAHLEHLRCLGRAAARTDRAGLWRYTVKAG